MNKGIAGADQIIIQSGIFRNIADEQISFRYFVFMLEENIKFAKIQLPAAFPDRQIQILAVDKGVVVLLFDF